MKKFAFALALMAAGATEAAAADMSVKAPAPPPVAGWTGWYIGVNAGGAWDADTSAGFGPGSPGTTIFFQVNEFPTSLSPRPSGGFGGGQIGYNRQVSTAVFGIEADLQGGRYSGSQAVSPIPTAGIAFNTTLE
jgi:outer membrane immunogenic protein